MMRYWFEEPYEAFVELTVCTTSTSTIRASAVLSLHDRAKVGLVELAEIDYVHRRPNFRSSSHPRIKGSPRDRSRHGLCVYGAQSL
ncbi:MAG: hypothetical protein ACLSHC_16900 [Bilophila wadsworthia]